MTSEITAAVRVIGILRGCSAGVFVSRQKKRPISAPVAMAIS